MATRTISLRLEAYERRGAYLSEAALDRIDEAKAADRPPEDKWTRN